MRKNQNLNCVHWKSPQKTAEKIHMKRCKRVFENLFSYVQLGIIGVEMEEIVLRVVRAYKTGRQPSSTVVIVPVEYHVQKGQRFLVKKDKAGRLIYEPLPGEAPKTPC